ncbi:3-hydroxybutyrate oligomer hydrolase family protein [Gilliamella mensalis]|uniref:3-hydroxybutyrate oligomer hydrolase family protein n=1 Tax=Gilliamella mensalis TaxID=1908520 RepID=UPI001428A668|nr:3-hydroxybutyrate oligomer hydrolase family protein [Gilliamella mensalis]
MIQIKILASLILFSTIALPLAAQTNTTKATQLVDSTEVSTSKKNTMTGDTNTSVEVNSNPQIGNTTIQKPKWLVRDTLTYYDGDSNDLVTAGLGFTPLSTATISPEVENPTKPNFQERRQAKLNRYIDTKNGEGTLFGFRKQELTPLFDGKIAGTEILAIQKQDGVGMLLQIPIDFDKNKPCIVAVPATDSDGVLNAKDVQIRGLWGLRHNCAVVYNDKGLGNGIYDIDHNLGFTLWGEVQSGSMLFYPSINNREQYIQKYPHRYAIKQLHSKLNTEARWGEHVLKSLEFAFYEINSMFSPNDQIIFNKDNTLVLVYGASDGGGAALKAGELDDQNMIDGIVAVNPQIQPNLDTFPVTLKIGSSAPQQLDAKSIANYSAYGALYIPCAIPAIKAYKDNSYVPYANYFLYSQERCNALKNAKLLTNGTPKEALEKLHKYGWTLEMDIQLPYFYYTESIGLPYQYISAYGKYDVTENMCNFSVASTQQNPIYYSGKVAPLEEISFEQIWGMANGHLPLWNSHDATVLDLVENEDLNTPRREFYSSSQTKDIIDYGTEGSICVYQKSQEPRVEEGIKQVMASGNLHGIKTFIVHGRNNVKQLPNYTSRAYVALNSLVEGTQSQLRYIEVENASYLDGRPPFDNTLLPIDYYGEDAIEWLWANLTTQATLPVSQVVHTKPRGGKSGYAPQITNKNLKPIMQSPNRNDVIQKNDGKLILPN